MPGAEQNKKPPRLRVDFINGAVAYRRKFGGGRNQALPKAIGMKAGHNPEVVDATAGLGRDAFLMASLGAKVTLIERSDEIYSLLAEGMEQAFREGGELAEIISRMTLVKGDSILLLPRMSPDVVLVDPMHPPRKNSALAKQEMRQIREIVGLDPDAVELMQAALAVARKRVVLKWPQKVDPIGQIPAPSHQIPGKSTRYDVWICMPPA